jgi:hypothetical protein
LAHDAAKASGIANNAIVNRRPKTPILASIYRSSRYPNYRGRFALVIAPIPDPIPSTRAGWCDCRAGEPWRLRIAGQRVPVGLLLFRGMSVGAWFKFWLPGVLEGAGPEPGA